MLEKVPVWILLLIDIVLLWLVFHIRKFLDRCNNWWDRFF